MITDPVVFDDRHLPRRLQHREAEVETLLRAWQPTGVGAAGDDVVVAGASGVGKTVLTRHTLGRVEDELGTDSAYVRCLGANGLGVLKQILQEHPDGVVSGSDRDREDDVDALESIVDEPFVVVLDEVEGILDASVLGDLADVELLSTVAICHDPHRWLARLSSHGGQWVDATQLTVDRYAVDELADILEARARVGLRDGVVDRRQLEWIADETAGVARYGIQVLRAAAEHADGRGAVTVSDEDVEASFDRARRYIREQNIRSLSLHHHVLYAIIYEAGTIDAAALHERYDVVADRVYADATLTPIVRRTRRNRLDKLVEYDLVEAVGDGVQREYRVVDDAVEPPISLSVRV